VFWNVFTFMPKKPVRKLRGRNAKVTQLSLHMLVPSCNEKWESRISTDLYICMRLQVSYAVVIAWDTMYQIAQTSGGLDKFLADHGFNPFKLTGSVSEEFVLVQIQLS
jgi:hypothetical protein